MLVDLDSPTEAAPGTHYSVSKPSVDGRSDGRWQNRPGGGGDIQAITQVLATCVNNQRIGSFYPPGSLESIAQRVAQSGALQRLTDSWSIPKEMAFDLVKLALFDIALLVDDSGSMVFEENGERVGELKLILQKASRPLSVRQRSPCSLLHAGQVAFACSLFDQDGISCRFLNST